MNYKALYQTLFILFKRKITANEIFERILIKESDVKNEETKSLIRKETTSAMYKNSQSKKFEIISNLEWNKSSKRINKTLNYVIFAFFCFKSLML